MKEPTEAYMKIIIAVAEEPGTVEAATKRARAKLDANAKLMAVERDRLIDAGIYRDVCERRKKIQDEAIRYKLPDYTAGQNQPEVLAARAAAATAEGFLDLWTENGTPIGDLTRDDCDRLAHNYASRAHGFAEKAEFFQRVRGMMKGKKPMRKCATAEQIQQLWEDIRNPPEPLAAAGH